MSAVPSEIAERVRKIRESLDAIEVTRAELQAELDEIIEAAGVHPDRKRGRPRKAGLKRPIRQGSVVWHAQQVLEKRGRAWYIDDLVRDVADLSGKSVQKTSLVSTLSRYVRAGEVFTRPKEGYYGLRAFEPQEAHPDNF
jgi:hypothetical protein